MTDIAVINPDKDALYERIRLLLFSADLPVQRLKADIDDIGRFTAPDVRSPHLRLVEAMPPLTPAAEAIVRAMIRAYGMDLFGRGSANSGLRALIKAGPVKFGQTALMLGPDAPVPERARPLVEEFTVPAVISMTAASSRPWCAGPARRRRRAKHEAGFAEKRKAWVCICVMAVLQGGQGMGKTAAVREAVAPAHPPGDSPRRHSQ